HAVVLVESFSAVPPAVCLTYQTVDRVAFLRGRFGIVELQVHESSRLLSDWCWLWRLRYGFRDLLDLHRGRLELGGSRDRVVRLDGERIRVHLIGEVARHEHQPGSQARLEPGGRAYRAPTRAHLDRVAVGDPHPCQVLLRGVVRRPD